MSSLTLESRKRTRSRTTTDSVAAHKLRKKQWQCRTRNSDSNTTALDNGDIVAINHQQQIPVNRTVSIDIIAAENTRSEVQQQHPPVPKWGRADVDLDSLLKDVDGETQRGALVELEENERNVLELLHRVWIHNNNKSKFGLVARYLKNLQHVKLEFSGFPKRSFQAMTKVSAEEIETMEIMLTSKIREKLCQMGYCTKTQKLQMYLSLLKSKTTEVQDPHIDFRWESISQKQAETNRSFHSSNYKERVPFIALFPLTADGMTVEVWNGRSHHDRPHEPQHEYGSLVHIAYGKILLLRADVVHAGGFANNVETGDPRAHFYIHKLPGGVLHELQLSNSYDGYVGEGDQMHKRMLREFYKHCIECENTCNVKVQSNFAQFTKRE